MGKTNRRCSSKINDYRECYTYGTYASYRDYRISSGNQQSRVAEHRLADCRSVDHRDADRRSADHRSVDSRSADRRSDDPRSVDPRSIHHRLDDRRCDDRRTADCRSVNHWSDDHRPADHWSADCRPVNHRPDDRRSNDRRSADHDCRPVNHRPDNRRSNDRRSADHDCRPINHRPDNRRSNDCRSADHECRPVNHRPDNRSSNDCRSADHDSVEHKQSKRRSADHSSVKHRIDRIVEHRSYDVVHRLAEHSSKDRRSAAGSSYENRLADHRLDEYSSTDRRSPDLNSVEHRLQSSDEQFIDFPSSEDNAKCHLMKVLEVAKPYLKQLLLYIVKDKKNSETLESYAIKQGMDFIWLKNKFTDEQISLIRQNPNCDNFDLTLIFKCIEVFKVFNPNLLKIENDNNNSNNCIKYMKDIRNDLCHNRNYLTASQWCDEAKSFKKSIGDLLDIINIWDGEMDNISENMKIGEEVDKVMNENISEKEFRYMCLLKVINSISEAVLNNVTRLIFYDKKEHNFKNYFFRKGMTARIYKDTFYKEEKPILESKSEEVQPDLTLSCKMIESCKTWHPSLKDNEHLKKELTNILKQIRGIRNHAIHKMLSMHPNECNMKAQELGESLKDLVNFIQNKKLDMSINAAKISINKIDSDIDFIMSMPYLYQ